MGENPIFGLHSRKVQPKLRMISNGNSEVNTLRAQDSSCIRVKKDNPLLKKPSFTTQLRSIESSTYGSKPKKGKLKTPPNDIYTSVFVHFTHSSKLSEFESKLYASALNTTKYASKENISMASIPLSEIQKLIDDDRVAYVEQGEPLSTPDPIELGYASPPRKSLRKIETTGGEDVLIGIIDVGGFAFDHEDFLDEDGNTRFVKIWDQGGTTRPSPEVDNVCSEVSFNYGSEITQEHMNTAIAQSENIGLPAYVLEPQSQMSTSSHGTHVASIAAGNRGICRKSRIAGVLIDIPQEHTDRKYSFYDSTRLAQAIDYIKSLAEDIKIKEKLEHLPISLTSSPS